MDRSFKDEHYNIINDIFDLHLIVNLFSCYVYMTS